MALLAMHLVLALSLVVLGRWGRAHAAELVWPSLPERDRERRIASVRRGGGLCFVVAGGLVLVALAALVT